MQELFQFIEDTMLVKVGYAIAAQRTTMMPGGGRGYGQQPGIILLREGTDSSQGKPQLISNINACGAVVDRCASSLDASVLARSRLR